MGFVTKITNNKIQNIVSVMLLMTTIHPYRYFKCFQFVILSIYCCCTGSMWLSEFFLLYLQCATYLTQTVLILEWKMILDNTKWLIKYKHRWCFPFNTPSGWFYRCNTGWPEFNLIIDFAADFRFIQVIALIYILRSLLDGKSTTVQTERPDISCWDI